MNKQTFNLNFARNFIFKSLLLITIFLSVGNGWGQTAAQYSFTQSAGTYTALVSPTVLGSGAALDNECYSIVSSSLAGFTFTFAGTNYTSFTVSANGFIGLGSSIMSGTMYSPLSATGGGNVFVSAYGDDLGGLNTATQISWKLEGASPNRQLVVEYRNIRNYNRTGVDLSFQIRLVESTNVINVVYGTMTYPSTTSDAVQVGIKSSSTSTHFSNRSTSSNWTTTSSGSSNSATCTVLNTVTMPTSGLTFTWAPPSPCVTPANQPTSLSFSSISSSSISGSFSAAPSSPSEYLVVRSTSATPPTPIDGTTYAAAATTLGSGTYVIQSSSATSFTSSSLSGNTTYYYHIFSFNNTGCSGGPKYLTVSPLSLSSTTCASSPSASAASNITTTSFTANWSASSGGAPLNYLLYVATDNSFTNLVSGYNGLDVGTVTNYSVTGLSAATTYYYRIMAVANSCNSTNSSTISITTNKIEPSNQITNLGVGSVTTTAIPLSWTAAVAGSQAPDGYLIKGSSVSLAVISDPVDGTDPSDVTAYTSNAANKKQTTGSSTSSSSFTSMTAGTMYYYKVYSYTNSATAIDFKTDNVPTLNYATKPSSVSTSLSNEVITLNTIDFTWATPSGYQTATNEYIIFAKAGSAITAGTPVLDISTYTASSTFGSGTVYEADASAYCVYKGDGNSISLSGLNPGVTYHFLMYAVVENPNSNGSFSYSVGTSVNRTTTKLEPSNQITNLGVGSVTSTAIPLSWTAAVAGSQAPDGYLIKGSSVSLAAISDPVDGTDPSDVTAYTSNAANKKQTTGSSTSSTSFTNMTAGTMYYYKVYSYTNTGTEINFKTDNVPTLNYATKPNSVSSTLSAVTITSSSIDFSWTAPAGYISATNEYLIFAKAGSAITVGSPTQNPSQYTASSTFGNGTSYQGDASAFCVFKGDGNSISLSGLNASTTYYFLIYSVVDLANSNGSFSYSSETGVNRSTLQIPAQLPYVDDFSTNSYSFVNGSTNLWVYGSAAGNPSNSIYVSNDNGVSNAYTTNSASVLHAYRDIAIPTGTTNVNFSFNWKANGESSYDYIRVWVVPTSFIPTAGVQTTTGSGRIQVGASLLSATTWQTYTSTTLNLSSFAGTTMRLIFEWTNDNSSGAQAPAAIDNVSISLPTVTWTGNTSASWNTLTNWSPNIVPSNTDIVSIPGNVSTFPIASSLSISTGGSITLQSSAQLTISGTLTNNGTLTLESGATLVQGSSSTLAGSGTYNVKQAITGDGTTTPSGRFWYLGSPVSLASSSVYFASNAANVVKKRSESTNAWTALSSGTPENLVVGQGYYTQAIPANSTINFTGGLLNNGAISITNLTRTAGQGFEGFNLVSNPYPSYLNWDVVSRTNVDGTMWYRTHDGTNMVFETYVAGAAGGVGTNLSGNTATKYIPPMQSYWVRVTQGQTSGSLALDNTMRSHFASLGSSTAGLRSTQDDPSLFLRMNLLQANKKDQLIVYVNEQATNGFDMLDGEKMMQAGYPQFYTKAGDKKIVINGLNSAKKQQALPVTIELPTTGVHSFVIEDLEISNGLVWLEDKQEEIIQAIEPGTVYEFYAASGLNSERFVLHFQLIDDAVPTNVYNEVNSSANFSGKGANVYAESAGVVVIKLPASAEGVTDIQIRDAAGKLVYAGSMNNLETSVELAQANGIYYITLSSNTGVEVRKVFIQQ